MTVSPALATSITIKKADSVQPQKKEAGGLLDGNSLIPTAITLATGIISMNQQMKALEGDCIPTQAEINWVSNMIKEQAKAGKDFSRILNNIPACRTHEEYRDLAYQQKNSRSGKGCYELWNSKADENMIWHNAPKASMGKICKSGSSGTYTGCASKDEETVSNIYDIFAMIDFTSADYTASEAAMAARLTEKHDKCSPVKLRAKQREMWGGFLLQTAGSVGVKQDMGNVLGSVNQILQQGQGGTLNTIMGLGQGLMQQGIRQ
ncbi:MAG: hypothetical protein FWG80_03985 [Alphaproteobacteria bacterium]|nr:hypothetical protein [Alphaproteobacteria bacterium]